MIYILLSFIYHLYYTYTIDMNTHPPTPPQDGVRANATASPTNGRPIIQQYPTLGSPSRLLRLDLVVPLSGVNGSISPVPNTTAAAVLQAAGNGTPSQSDTYEKLGKVGGVGVGGWWGGEGEGNWGAVSMVVYHVGVCGVVYVVCVVWCVWCVCTEP